MSKNITTLTESDIQRIVLRILEETNKSNFLYEDLFGSVEETNFIIDDLITEA